MDCLHATEVRWGYIQHFTGRGLEFRCSLKIVVALGVFFCVWQFVWVYGVALYAA